MDILFLVGRVVVGLYFTMMGLMHFKNAGMLAGYAQSRGAGGGKGLALLSGVVILFGGLGVLLGFLVEWAIAALVVFLVLAAFLIHHFWTDQDPQQRMGEMVNFMKNLALAAALLMLYGVATPWPLSLF